MFSVSQPYLLYYYYFCLFVLISSQLFATPLFCKIYPLLELTSFFTSIYSYYFLSVPESLIFFLLISSLLTSPIFSSVTSLPLSLSFFFYLPSSPFSYCNPFLHPPIYHLITLFKCLYILYLLCFLYTAYLFLLFLVSSFISSFLPVYFQYTSLICPLISLLSSRWQACVPGGNKLAFVPLISTPDTPPPVLIKK